MDHPYDAADQEPSLAATLAVLREREPAPSPNAGMIEVAARVSRPLAAIAHTLGSYLPGPDFGRFETTAELADNDLDDWAEDLQNAGCNLNDCLLLGTAGGGEEFLFMAANDTPAGYALFLWAMDGQPYRASGAPLWRVGTFADLFAHLATHRIALDPRLAAIAG